MVQLGKSIPDWRAAWAAVRERMRHSDAIIELRRRFGADLPAILITADRSPHMRDEARAKDVQVLSKPLKPAALRALMAQWRVPRVAAAE